MLKRWLLYLGSVVLGLGVVGALLGAFVLALLWPTLPSLEVLTDYQPKIPLRIVSAEGALLGGLMRDQARRAERRRHVAQARVEEGGAGRAGLLRVDHDGRRVWVEAKVVEQGDCSDAVPSMGGAGKVPVDPVVRAFARG